jgi:hypothetical protein
MSDTGTEPVRDSRGRDARVHGLVLDEGNPAPTMRELLRQWSEAGVESEVGSLYERTVAVLDVIGPDGTATSQARARSAGPCGSCGRSITGPPGEDCAVSSAHVRPC